MSRRVFIGKKKIYQIPHGAVVTVLRFFPRRRALIEYKGIRYLTMSTLLRKVPE